MILLKKKAISVVAIILVLVLSVAAAPRWTYFHDVIAGAKFQNGGIDYSAVATTYDMPEITHTEVIVKLQVSTGGGWGTIKTLSSKTPGHTAGIGEIYTEYLPNKSYRIAITCKAYSSRDVFETIGPLYDYANTPA